jgi:hypothetical protein
MDQLDQVFDLLNKREAMRLVARALAVSLSWYLEKKLTPIAIEVDRH